MEPPVHGPDLLFTYDFPPMGGGIARWMDELARGYPAGSLVVSTGRLDGSAATDASLPQRVDRIAVSSERLRTIPGGVRWSWRATQLARAVRAPFAWCDSVRPAGYPACWARLRTGLPYGIVVHGGDLLTLRGKLVRSSVKQRMMRTILGHAAVFVANSRWTADRCRQLLGDAGIRNLDSRVRVVPLGAHPDRWHADAEAVNRFRARHHLPPGRWLVTVARLVEYKGVDTAMRVVAALGDDHPDLQFAVIGRGEYETALRSLARALQLEHRIHFLTHVDDAELPAAFASAEVYIGLTHETATDIEGFGISFVEAAAAGLPVVATRTGGIPDAVADGVGGVLVEDGDFNAAVAAVRGLLNDTNRARAMGIAGHDRVVGHLNWNRVVADMRAIAAEYRR